LTLDPGSEMEKIRIRDKHPGSATLPFFFFFVLAWLLDLSPSSHDPLIPYPHFSLVAASDILVFFSEVPGLLEKRPSLVIGDTVLVSDPGVRISLPSSFAYRPGVTLCQHYDLLS
jgi:hypothetical protein